MKRVIAALMALVLCLSMTACGLLKKDMTMDEYMQKNQTLYNTIADTMSDENVTMEFSARGDSLVLSAKMDMAIDETVKEVVAAAMDASLEEGKQDYLDMLEDVREDVSAAKSIIVEFYDSEDTLIISKEFS